MATDRISTWGADLEVTLGMVRGAGDALMVLHARLDCGDVTAAQAEALELQIDAARRLVSGVMGSIDGLHLYMRRALVESRAPGWRSERGQVSYKDADGVDYAAPAHC